MIPAARFLRNLFERWKGRYYEGPQTPRRLQDLVLAFAAQYPKATRGEWTAFARGLADQSYRSGYVRGFEWAERDLDRRDPEYEPEVLAEIEGNDWEWFDDESRPAPSDMGMVVLEERDDAADRTEHVREAFEHGRERERAEGG